MKKLFEWETPLQLGMLLASAESVFDPIREVDRQTLRKKAQQLKQTDGESWAIGEMLERACILFDAIESDGQIKV